MTGLAIVTDIYPALSQQIFNVAMAEVESVVKPYGVLDDFGGKAISFVNIFDLSSGNCYRISANLSVPGFVVLL